MADDILVDLKGSCIYRIRNIVNGKFYVGSAVCCAARWRQHRCDLGKGRHNRHLQNAWKKYGEGAFVFEVIESVSELAELVAREQHYIDTLKPEYNIAKIAGSNLGVRHSDEVKGRMAVASKAIWQRPGYRQRMSDAHKGQQFTEEHRRKISAATSGRKLSAEHAATVAKNNAARNRSDAHRLKMSDFWKGRPKTPEQIEKTAASRRGQVPHNKGKPASPEQKAKQSATMKAKYTNDPTLRDRVSQATRAAMSRPEIKSKVAGANLGRKQSEETKRKRSESLRRTHDLRRAS